MTTLVPSSVATSASRRVENALRFQVRSAEEPQHRFVALVAHLEYFVARAAAGGKVGDPRFQYVTPCAVLDHICDTTIGKAPRNLAAWPQHDPASDDGSQQCRTRPPPN